MSLSVLERVRIIELFLKENKKNMPKNVGSIKT